MITRGAKKGGSGVGDLRGHHRTRNPKAVRLRVRRPILISPEQHITGRESDDARKKSAAGRQERDCDSVLGAQAEQSRAGIHSAKADYASERMDGCSQPDLLADGDDYVESLATQPSAFGLHEQCVEMMPHGALASVKVWNTAGCSHHVAAEALIATLRAR
jgi:hypothetical protein